MSEEVFVEQFVRVLSGDERECQPFQCLLVEAVDLDCFLGKGEHEWIDVAPCGDQTFAQARPG